MYAVGDDTKALIVSGVSENTLRSYRFWSREIVALYTETKVTQKCKLYTHRHLNWKLQWVVQYTSIYDCTLVTTTTSYWEVCKYRYPNGNQCGG